MKKFLESLAMQHSSESHSVELNAVVPCGEKIERPIEAGHERNRSAFIEN